MSDDWAVFLFFFSFYSRRAAHGTQDAMWVPFISCALQHCNIFPAGSLPFVCHHGAFTQGIEISRDLWHVQIYVPFSNHTEWITSQLIVILLLWSMVYNKDLNISFYDINLVWALATISPLSSVEYLCFLSYKENEKWWFFFILCTKIFETIYTQILKMWIYDTFIIN